MKAVKIRDRQIARIGLGTNRLHDTPANAAFIRAAVSAGIQMIDTAHVYATGESERVIGEALSPLPPDCLVATKGGYGGPGHGRPEVLREDIEQSLARLRTDRIGLYYLHRVDPDTPIEESLGAIKSYVDRGAIEHVGLSEVGVAEIERARTVVPIAAVQNNYSLAERKYDDVVEHCAGAGIAFVPFFPRRGTDAAAVRSIAQAHRATPTQIVLAWLLRRSPAMLPIPGTLSLDHVRENLAVLSIELSDEEFDELARGSITPA